MSVAKIREALESAVEASEVVGAVGLVTGPDETLATVTAGYQDLESGLAMPAEALFCIASMTKPITAVAVLMMADEGKLSLDDPLSRHLPEFTALRDAEDHPVEVTIRECLSHTSGMSDLNLGEDSECRVLAELIPMILAKPVGFPPGSAWCYCQTSINMVAHVVEKLSGLDFASFLSERIFDPLGMARTTFYPDAGEVERMASIYERTRSGEWRKTSHDWVTFGRLESRERYPKANAGLFSTAEDYARFCRCLLKNGEGLISKEGFRELGSIQTGDLETGFTPGNAWGLGCAITRFPQGVTAALSPGTYGHGGLYGTQGWIDPIREQGYLLMVQRSDFKNADASGVRQKFQEASIECFADVS